MVRFIIFVFLLSSLLFASVDIVRLEVKGAISPASAQHLKDGMKYAKEQNAQMLLVELDTPGGLSTSMREMIQDIANSSIPVVTYVYPKGAHAASAGTYLLYASHIAVMSPGTNLGAATPVSIMPSPKGIDSNSSDMSTLEKKVTYDAMAYIKSLAELNDRNISWALLAVEKAKSISAEEALSYGVIDIIADDRQELLKKLDGVNVKISGKTVTLNTKDVVLHYFERNWKNRFLSTIVNSNIAYILLLVAIYGIFFELMNPGSIFPGVVGIISGIIALYALNMLPFNYAGLLLILL